MTDKNIPFSENEVENLDLLLLGVVGIFEKFPQNNYLNTRQEANWELLVGHLRSARSILRSFRTPENVGKRE